MLSPDQRSRPRRASIIMILLGTVAFFGPSLYQRLRMTFGLSSRTISKIEILPNGDHPRVALRSDKKIDAFVKWLRFTGDDSAFRSAPPPTVFDGSITFVDGHVEDIHLSAILPPLNNDPELSGSERWERRLLEPRSDVRVNFRGIIRTGDRQPLANLVSREAADN